MLNTINLRALVQKCEESSQRGPKFLCHLDIAAQPTLFFRFVDRDSRCKDLLMFLLVIGAKPNVVLHCSPVSCWRTGPLLNQANPWSKGGKVEQGICS